MFDLCVAIGAKLHITNRLNLTPLTLAAKLAKEEVCKEMYIEGAAAQMFRHVLTTEREVLWTYGDVICAAYPLGYIDSIDQQTGELNDDSALANVVYGVSECSRSLAHLQMCCRIRTTTSIY
jgi:hypothetical protein